jgi:hypothetical protein
MKRHVYETPFGQCITEWSLNKLQYADYTIFSLSPADCVRTKSLFHTFCYSVKEWVEGIPTTWNPCPSDDGVTADWIPDRYALEASEARGRDNLIRNNHTYLTHPPSEWARSFNT